MKLEKEREVAIQVAQNEFRVLFPIKTSVIFRCGRNESRQMLTGLQKVIVNPGCSVVTPSNYLHVAPDIEIADNHILMQLPPVTLDELHDLVKEMIDDDSLKSIKEHLEKMSFPDVKLSTLKHLQALQEVQQNFKDNFKPFSLGHSLWIVLKIIIVLIIIAGMIYVAYKIYRRRNPQSGLHKMKVRFSELKANFDKVKTNVEHQGARERLEGGISREQL
jgi:cell division protein FtsL